MNPIAKTNRDKRTKASPNFGCKCFLINAVGLCILPYEKILCLMRTNFPNKGNKVTSFEFVNIFYLNAYTKECLNFIF